ncbi:hypothetical protein PGN35_000360 [Nodosilinea sp. PGN35]|uniref:VMAP-C domain-containing protein n=1 Tax=Nodosilinea sp. PGN35 TaxID=3020489 RepID=UPI0023B30AC0|nr:hypothetical protein [Nodosilinea sp. TSF1-S3]MDF0369134.1 hypothetical protein [Nodosilinea sp. TSF1-S3]
MPTSADLSPQERLALITVLNALPDPSFKMLVFALQPPAGVLPSDLAAQGDRVFTLLQWVEGTGPGLGLLQEILSQITGKPLVERPTRLATADWAVLFSRFSPYDFAVMQGAFLKAFQEVYAKGFWQVRPDNPPLNEPGQIQKLITTFDDPLLAVRFVEQVVAAFRGAKDGKPRDLAEFERWRDRIAQTFNVPPAAPPAPNTAARHPYLLVALEAHGSDVNLYPELRVSGVEKPLGFGACPKTCTLAEAAAQISGWIHQAEAALEAEACDDGEVTLEVFLPCQYLDEDIAANWQMQDKRGGEVTLGNYRRFLVRSLERVRDRSIQRALARRWQLLDSCQDIRALCHQFHRQAQCPSEKGSLQAMLKDLDALGLKFVAQLPTDATRRLDLLYEIIDAAVPIALWASAPASDDAATLEAEFDALLGACQWTNFADLARGWRLHRLRSPAATPIRLLCDRPDRLPHLPDPNREEDLLVAL